MSVGNVGDTEWHAAVESTAQERILGWQNMWSWTKRSLTGPNQSLAPPCKASAPLGCSSSDIEASSRRKLDHALFAGSEACMQGAMRRQHQWRPQSLRAGRCAWLGKIAIECTTLRSLCRFHHHRPCRQSSGRASASRHDRRCSHQPFLLLSPPCCRRLALLDTREQSGQVV